MGIVVRTLENENERREFIRVANTAFAGDASSPAVERGVTRSAQRMDVSNLIGAFDGGQMVGTSFSFPLDMTVPGGADLSVSWIAAVSTLPSHRRRGVMTDVLTYQLSELRKSGVAAAALASETGKYRKLGFSPSAAFMTLKFGKDRKLRRSEPMAFRVTYSQGTSSDQLRDLHERWRKSHVGEISRDRAWWAFPGRNELRHIVLQSHDDEIVAWASYSVAASGTTFNEYTELTFHDVISTSPESRRALWRVILGFDVADSIIVESVPRDDLVFRMVAEAPQIAQIESPWLRILDVPKALTSRKYSHRLSPVYIEVWDNIIPENCGTYRIQSQANGELSCERVSAAPDLTIDVADLASVFSGLVTFKQLSEAGNIHGMSSVSIGALDKTFTASQSPYCSLYFV